jgi:1-phosphofructokinase
VILTVTANPSIDRTVTLSTELVRGAVHRVQTVSTEPGGKGVNVAHALTLAGVDAVALLPAAGHDPMVVALTGCGVPFQAVHTAGLVRTNLAITESDGTTTKLNEFGDQVGESVRDELMATIVAHAERASWVVLSGSLPPGIPDSWYAEVVSILEQYPCNVAVDTSGPPLLTLASHFGSAAPDLVKPNVEELAILGDTSNADLENALSRGNVEPIRVIAERLVEQGVGAVLATLGAAGALLVTASGTWLASPPPVSPRSTVGAGDSALAGYLIADSTNASAAQRLQMAVAYGSAAAALPGSTLPTPQQIDLDGVKVTSIRPYQSVGPTESVGPNKSEVPS